MLSKCVVKTCPICYKNSSCNIDIEKYYQFLQGKVDVKAMFPKYSKFRERLLKEGICFTCQEKMYNQPSPDNENVWGEQLGNCPKCERPIYRKDLNKEGIHICKRCQTTVQMIL